MTRGPGPPQPLGLLPHGIDISLPSYTFETNEWIEAPALFPERFQNETLETTRRDNDTAFKLVGNKSTWHKYVAVGYHCYDHCFQFETQWNYMAKSESDILTFVWLMHSYHLERKLSPLAILSKWAKDIAQPYLAIHKPASSIDDGNHRPTRGTHEVQRTRPDGPGR
jgi:hypothetical protein